MSPRIPALQPDHDRHVLTIALSAQLDSRGGTQPLTAARFWGALAELDGDLRAATTSADPDLRQFARRSTAAALHAAELGAQNIGLITPFHPDYPTRYLERLGRDAPPLLYVAGDTTVFAATGRPRLAVVGSPDATQRELESARDAADAAASRGWDVVSGSAKGVDAVALNAAVARGGIVIALLTDGVRRAMRKGALRRLVSSGQAVLASPVHPDAGSTDSNASARYELIYGLADMTYVVAVDAGGGDTWNGAVEALRRGYGAVAVHDDADAADALQALGGRRIRTSAELFEPDPDRDAPAHPVQEPPPTSQESLFD